VARELANVQKCLAAGYDRAIVVTRERRARQALVQAIEAHLAQESRERVAVVTPEEIVELLDGEDAKAASRDTTVRGYKVKVRYAAGQAADAALRKETISKVLLGRLKRPER
jgi:hypothetical protein